MRLDRKEEEGNEIGQKKRPEWQVFLSLRTLGPGGRATPNATPGARCPNI